MTLSVNTNISSALANRAVESGRTLESTLSRLSSGLRINSSADDTGGLQIAARLQGDRVTLSSGASSSIEDNATYGNLSLGNLGRLSSGSQIDRSNDVAAFIESQLSKATNQASQSTEATTAVTDSTVVEASIAEPVDPLTANISPFNADSLVKTDSERYSYDFARANSDAATAATAAMNMFREDIQAYKDMQSAFDSATINNVMSLLR